MYLYSTSPHLLSNIKLTLAVEDRLQGDPAHPISKKDDEMLRSASVDESRSNINGEIIHLTEYLWF